MSKSKKRLMAAVLSGSMILSAGVPVFAFADSEEIFTSVFGVEEKAGQEIVDLSQSGYVLQRLGLISGDENGDLMLEKTGTRAEAFTIFLSLLGEQDEAGTVSYSYGFTDVSSWFSNFAGYGLYHHYSSGCSEKSFGSQDDVTVEQYMTFVLKALGYSSDSDFTWSESVDKAVEIGLCTQEQADSWQNNTFRRQEIMEISYLALNTRMKDRACTLTDKLIAEGEITEEAAEEEGLTFGEIYIPLEEEETSTSAVTTTTLTAGSYELHNVGSGKIMTASSSKQTDVVVAADTDADNQMFQIINNDDGSFQIASGSNASLLLDVNPTDGADALLWTQNGTDCQTFVAVQVSSGVYSIRLKANTDMALTVSGTDVRLSAYDGSTNQQWTLSTNQDDTATATAMLEAIMEIYPSGTNLGSSYSFGGASQCMAFGREVFYRMFGSVAKWNYDGSPKSSSDGELYTITAQTSSYSASSVKSLISKAKPGDILQMDSSKIHTMVFVSSDDEGFTVYDANWTASNQVSVRYVKYGAWVNRDSDGLSLLHSTNYPKI